jgi:hypothetical protein
LQLKLPDHFPDDPYPLDAIFKAAQYVLHGTNLTLLITSTNSMALTTGQANAVKAKIKTEDLTAILEHLTETFIKALSSQQQNNRATDHLVPLLEVEATATFVDCLSISFATAWRCWSILRMGSVSAIMKEKLSYPVAHTCLVIFLANGCTIELMSGTVAILTSLQLGR